MAVIAATSGQRARSHPAAAADASSTEVTSAGLDQLLDARQAGDDVLAHRDAAGVDGPRIASREK